MALLRGRLSGLCASIGAPWELMPGRPIPAGKGLGFCRPLAYMMVMEFEWDDAKSEACLAGRGFDFAYAIKVLSIRIA